MDTPSHTREPSDSSIATSDETASTPTSTSTARPPRGWTTADTKSLGYRFFGRFHIFGTFWYQAHYYGARLGFTGRIANAILVTMFFCILRTYRRIMAANLEVVLGPTSWWRTLIRVYKACWAFANCRSARYTFLQKNVAPPELVIEGDENWKAITADGRGFIIATAHVGNYEGGGILPADLIQRPIHQVRNREPDPRTQAFMERMIEEHSPSNCVTHYMAEQEAPDLKTSVALMNALRAGEIVAMPGDRAPQFGKVVASELFGRPYLLPEGPFSLARTAGVPMIVVFMFWLGPRKFRIVLREPIEVPKTADRAADVQVAADRYTKDLQWAIRESPYQWFCFRKAFAS